MNRTQAISTLRKVLGDRFAYRVDATAPDAEQREVMRAKWQLAQDAAAKADLERVARLEQLLAEDPTYQRLKAKATEAKAAALKAREGLGRYRVTVGRSGALFFSIEAQGDNWAEVVDLVKKGKH